MNKKYKFDPTNPTASYESRNTSQMDALTDQYMNRGAFTYDPNTDKAFQDYANIMLKNGNMAMKDTAAKAASMTGGFGNSYAQTAGQSVYNNYVDQIGLAEREFRNDALAQYNAAGNDLLSKLGLLEQQEARDKAAWEEDYANAYAMAQNAATYNGDYSGLARFLGTDEEKLNPIMESANTKRMTDENYAKYKEALLSGNGESYLDELELLGYDVSDAYAMRNQWENNGEIAKVIGIDNDERSGTWGQFRDAANDNIDGIPRKITKGNNFSVKNGDVTYKVEIGEKVSTSNKIGEYASQNNPKGLIVFSGELYYGDGKGNIYSVNDRGGRDGLIKYILGGA